MQQEREKGKIENSMKDSQKTEREKRKKLKNVAHTGDLVPSARCEEYLCKVKQKREELEKVYTQI